jgi:cellulose synthase/poly-beta-1,6-N-acetylglucosamine synthase-like glycosyltransferase
MKLKEERVRRWQRISRREMTNVADKSLSPPSTSYVIVSPVRDEAKYLDETIRCVVNQTVRPLRYILVNDGSSDSTLEIIERWSAQYPWIVPVHRPDSRLSKGPMDPNQEA